MRSIPNHVKKRRTWSLHVVVLEGTAKKCTNILWTQAQVKTGFYILPSNFADLFSTPIGLKTCSSWNFKCGEIRDTKSLNLSRNIVSLQVLGRCFPFFTLRDQLGPQQKHLLRVEEMRRADWLICLVGVRNKLRALKPKFLAQRRTALYFSQKLSSTRSKCFCCATS